MNCKMKFRITVIGCGTALLIAAAVAVVVASRNRHQPAPPPDLLVAALPAEVHVKAVERRIETLERGEVAAASGAVAIVCGEDAATADRYEARNDALRSIARRRDLAKGDVDALLAYLRRADDAMRVERVAALKNDIMNLFRNQDPPAEGMAETLIAMFEGRGISTHNSSTPNSPTHPHPPAVLDYCIQHLGAMVNELDDAMCNRVQKKLLEKFEEWSSDPSGWGGGTGEDGWLGQFLTKCTKESTFGWERMKKMMKWAVCHDLFI